MYLVIASSKDLASMNIRDKLLALVEWREVSRFKEMPVFRYEKMYLLTNDGFHIYAEDLDREIRQRTDIDFDKIIFASRHRAESGTHSLTVHPIGNFSQAKFGGSDNTLVTSMPHEMTHAYRRLLVNAEGLGYEITFEATHHGPYLRTPTMFIEIGSDETQWKNEKAGEAIARTILEIPEYERSRDVLVGVGGGHYCPRHSDVAKGFDVSYGHIIPGWALRDATDEAILMAVKDTPGAEKVYLHRKALKGAVRRRLSKLFTENGYPVVSTKELVSRESDQRP